MELKFPQGLPGFEKERRFVTIERPDLAPVVGLQSTASPQLCLWAAPVDTIDPAYTLDLAVDDLRLLGFEAGREPRPGAELQCLAILCAAENGPLTANLLAPVVVNLKNGIAVQAVRGDRRYSHRHPIGPEAACW